MTKSQFIASIEAKPNFIRWAEEPTLHETVGGVETWHGRPFHTTDDGTNIFNVWFHVDTQTGEATWQTGDNLEPEKNKTTAKMMALTDYLKANFSAFFVTQIDLTNNWAEATVYSVSGQDLVKSTVLVFKQGTNPITHRKVI